MTVTLSDIAIWLYIEIHSPLLKPVTLSGIAIWLYIQIHCPLLKPVTLSGIAIWLYILYLLKNFENVF